MSPTATIATVVVALIFFAWVFQSDVKDPALEEALKRQAADKKAEVAKNPLGIAVTDAGVTKDNSTVAERGKRGPSNLQFVDDSMTGLPAGFSFGGPQINPEDPEPQEKQPEKGTFPNNQRLNGTYVHVAFLDDAPKSDGDQPAITFRRDGSFATVNMATAEVDFDAAGLSGSVDRGTGRYKLYGTTLELIYTDGLTRKKGPKRSYTVLPLGEDTKNPPAITIQGKIFKLDANR